MTITTGPTRSILDVLVFCVVIAFIDEAARHLRAKMIERRWLVLAAALICGASFAIHRTTHLNRQMTLVSRDLNICAVILDLILWSLLFHGAPADPSPPDAAQWGAGFTTYRRNHGRAVAAFLPQSVSGPGPCWKCPLAFWGCTFGGARCARCL